MQVDDRVWPRSAATKQAHAAVGQMPLYAAAIERSIEPVEQAVKETGGQIADHPRRKSTRGKTPVRFDEMSPPPLIWRIHSRRFCRNLWRLAIAGNALGLLSLHMRGQSPFPRGAMADNRARIALHEAAIAIGIM